MSYPDFIADRDGLDRWRETCKFGGHKLVANRNTVLRFVQTIDALEAKLNALSPPQVKEGGN